RYALAFGLETGKTGLHISLFTKFHLLIKRFGRYFRLYNLVGCGHALYAGPFRQINTFTYFTGIYFFVFLTLYVKHSQGTFIKSPKYGMVYQNKRTGNIYPKFYYGSTTSRY